MLETAIVGGGVCGLALATSLSAQNRPFLLFEARDRLGGRVLSVPCARAGMDVDLGPTWFWPNTQPLVTRLVADLGLADFPQHDEGTVLHLRDPDKRPERIDGYPVHGGARRIEGGMGRLVEALTKYLSRDCIQLGHVLTAVTDCGDHVKMEFRNEGRRIELKARQIVLAIPPRLVAERVRFEPALDDTTTEAMRGADTWMAARAKVVIGYDRPLWREAGASGNAFVAHEQAVIGEIFDACDGTAAKAALGGFLALSPELRKTFDVGLPMLMGNQMAQVFGPELEHGQQHFMDWATEPFTCSALDREAPDAEHNGFANPVLRRALWNRKLYLGGSETAAHGSGYLEGALEAARRIDRALPREKAFGGLGERVAARNDNVGSETSAQNAECLATFRAWVVTQKDIALEGYRHRLNRDLALQQKEQLTQRAILGSVEEVYSNALTVLDGLPLDTEGVPVDRGRSALTPEIQEPFRDFMRSLLDDVIAFNQTSCALSNFPDEHHLSQEYVQTILKDIAAAWREFSLAANALLLAKAGNVRMKDRPGSSGSS